MNFRQDPEMLMRYHRVQAIVGQLNEVEERQKQRQKLLQKQQAPQKKSSIKSKHSQKSKLKFQLSWGSKESEILADKKLEHREHRGKAKKQPSPHSASSKSLEHTQGSKHLQPAAAASNPAVERSLSWGGRETKRDMLFQMLLKQDGAKSPDLEAQTSGDSSFRDSIGDAVGSPVIVIGTGESLATPVVVLKPSQHSPPAQQL